MSFLEKLRQKPEKTKKRILYIIVFSSGIFLIIFWVLNMKYNFARIDFSNFPRPDINKDDFINSKEKIDDFEEQINKGLDKSEK